MTRPTLLSINRSRAWLGRCARVCAASLFLASPIALAQPSQAETDRAVALFKEGRDLITAGNLEGARAKLSESLNVQPLVGTLLNLADCEERLGLLVGASGHWAEALVLAAKLGDDRLAEARDRAQKLDARVPKLRVRLAATPPPATKVMLAQGGAAPKELTELGRELPLNPGKYQVWVMAPGRKDRVYEVKAVEGSRAVLEVDVGPDLSKPVAPVPRQPREPAAPAPERGEPGAPSPLGAPTTPDRSTGAPDASSEGEWSAGRTAGLVVGLTGIVSLGIGAALGGVAMSKTSDAKDHCNDNDYCDADGLDLRSQAISMARGSTATFIIGGALVVGGLITFLVAPTDGGDDSSEPGATARLVIGPNGVQVLGRW
jgi:hypothetical protein